jgi:hypothetical protein
MKEKVASLVKGDDSAFEPLMQDICAGKIMILARRDAADDHALIFFDCFVDDMNYIPLFTDRAEIDSFCEPGELESWEVFDMDGNLLAATVDDEQFLMINPVSGGIMFQGHHLKIFVNPSQLP